MASLASMMQAARLRLGECRAQKPSSRAVLQAVTTKTQDLFNQLSNTGAAWAIDELTLKVVNGTQDYLLPVSPYFGKPLQVLTYYPQNPSYIPRYVDFVWFSDMNFDWNLPYNVASFYGNLDGSPNTAQRIAFYRKGGQDNIWARILPVPQLSAQYLVSYAIGSWADDAGLDDSPVLSQFHPLIEVQAATSLLAQAEWVDDMAENRMRRKEYAQSFQYDEAALQDGFTRYIRRLATDHMDTRASSFDSGAYGGGR